jgi:uncharacterized iron-regulated membrane protein
MLTARAIRTWSALHKWSSLACTVFMLLLCVTGLPLIFHHEIGEALGTEVEAPAMPAGTPRISLDRVLEVARERYPQRVVQFASQEPDSADVWYVTMTPTPAPTADFQQVPVDARTGAVLPRPPLHQGFMWIMDRLHVDLFAGQAGKLFLGAMGLLLLVSIASGVVLYAPFMRKLAFGKVRHDRSPRVRWLDLHNLLGIVTLAWLLVVGATGVLNTWAELLQRQWQSTQLAGLLGAYREQPPIADAQRAPVQRALEAALAHAPGTKVAFIAFPGTTFSSPRHLTFYLRGSDPLHSRLPQPVLVDAGSATVTAAVRLPWYLVALQISRPLHFGDYGGMPMKMLWAALDLLSIIVLGSGLYLWLGRRGAQPQDLDDGLNLAKAAR